MPVSLTDLAGLRVGAEDFLTTVLETAAQPIWVVDPDDLIRFANPAAIAALGYDSAEELFGRHSHETIHYKHRDGTPYPAAECPMLRPRATGETVESDLDWFFRRDGSMFPVSYVSAPIEMPGGRGAVVAFSDIEDRRRTERLLREHDALLAAREASLRRIATLVAGGAASAEVFAAIAREVAQVLGVSLVVIWRYEAERPATVVGAWADRSHPFQAGTTWPVEEHTVAVMLPELDRPTWIEDFGEIGGMIPDAIAGTGIRSGSGAAIIVDGELWGVMGAGVAESEPLVDHIEDRLVEFTELVATTISNSASKEKLAGLADEQAALRRVATLVAQGVPASELFGAVAEAVGRLLGTDLAGLLRYESDDTVTVLGGWSAAGEHVEVGGRWPLDPHGLEVTISRTGRPARIDDLSEVPGRTAAVARDELGIGSSVGCPIVVERRVWGALFVHSTRATPLPADTESRLENFTELVATAMANAHARAQADRLADEQAALRRVATLVAREAPAGEVFAAVAEELGRLLDVDATRLVRYEDDDTATVVSTWGRLSEVVPVGTRLPLGGVNVISTVSQTGRPARIDDYGIATGVISGWGRRLGARSAVGGPIVVSGRVWGAMIVTSRRPEPMPAGTEAWIEAFAELVATAIANIEARSELAASRARIVAATDEERRRVVRDLHDGAQQRLVHTVITLKLALKALEAERQSAGELVTEALGQAQQANVELRELAHGILPSVLTHGGLRAGVEALASRAPVVVEQDVSAGRLPAAVEATAYFVVAEALTNVAKYAQATQAAVTARLEDGALRIQVRDDGVGGARPDGSGLLGLRDRLAALDGQLRVESPLEGGTLIAADIPVAGS